MADINKNQVFTFVKPVNSYLYCSLCQKIYTDPVVNVSCGHSFCRQCLTVRILNKTFTCPVDGVASVTETKNLVVNRSLQDQIDDLDVWCRYRFKWSEDVKDFAVDTDGCKDAVKYAAREAHEDACGFAFVFCPNGQEKCGKLRRSHLKQHFTTCKNESCTYQIKGCNYASNAEEVALHQTTCIYKNQQTIAIDVKQFNGLITSQKQLEEKLNICLTKSEKLEAANYSLTKQIETCLSTLQLLSQKQLQFDEKLERLITVVGTNGFFQKQNNHSNSNSMTGSFEGTPHNSFHNSLMHATSGPKMESWVMPFQFKCIGSLRSHKGGVWCLKTWRKNLFSCGSDNVIKVWDLDNLVQGCKSTITAHEQRIHTMAVGKQFLYTAGEDLTIKSWYLESITEHKSIEMAHEKCVAALLCTEDFLFSSSYTVIKIWKCADLELVHTISNLHHWVRALACSPLKDKVYSGSHGNIDIWSPKADFNLIGKITHSHGSVHSLVITSTFIIVGTYNQNTHVYDIITNQHLHHLMGHVGIVNSLVVSPSGKFMFTGSSDSTVLVWSLEKMLPIQTLQRHNDSVNTLIVNGDILLSGSEDTEIKVFKHFRMQMGFMPT